MRIRDKVKPTVPPLPGGNYLGICVYSIDLGEQLSEFEGKSKGYYNKVMLGFEICGQSVTVDGKDAPRILSKHSARQRESAPACACSWGHGKPRSLAMMNTWTKTQWTMLAFLRSCL